MGKKIKKAFSSITKPFKKAAKGLLGAGIGGGLMKDAFGLDDKKPDPVQAPAPDAPEGAETTTQAGVGDEKIDPRRKKGRTSLRIDLNAGGAPVGNGVNVPRG